MDFALTDENRHYRDIARRLANEVVGPCARSSDADRHFDRDVITAVAKEGLFGGPFAKADGGLGLGHVTQALIYEELGRADSSVRGFMAVQTGLCGGCLDQFGSDGQKRRYLPRIAAVDVIASYALTEEEAGSDVASMSTTASKTSDGWTIDGKKIWITNGPVADLFIVFAKTDVGARHRGISCFLVPGDAAGLRRERMEAPELGHRGSLHARVTFDGVKVGPDALVGEQGQGFKIAMAALDHGRLGVAAGAVGVHQACFDAALAFAQDRRQFGQRIGDFQMVQKTLTDMYADLEASRALTLKAAWLKDVGESATRAVSVAKLFSTEKAAKAAHDAVLLHGGRGYNNDFPVERYLRDIVGLEIYEGTSNIQRIIVARDLLGRDERKGTAS